MPNNALSHGWIGQEYHMLRKAKTSAVKQKPCK